MSSNMAKANSLSNQSHQQQTKDIVTPAPHDVLCGRGNFVNEHNSHFRALVHLHKKDYVFCERSQKGKYSQLIVDAVRGMVPPGRFLDRDPKTDLWYEIGNRKALTKTRQALREGAPVLMKEMAEARAQDSPRSVEENSALSITHDFEVVTPPLTGETSMFNGSSDQYPQFIPPQSETKPRSRKEQKVIIANQLAPRDDDDFSISAEPSIPSEAENAQPAVPPQSEIFFTPTNKDLAATRRYERRNSITLDDLAEYVKDDNSSPVPVNNYNHSVEKMSLSLEKLQDSDSNFNEMFRASLTFCPDICGSKCTASSDPPQKEWNFSSAQDVPVFHRSNEFDQDSSYTDSLISLLSMKDFNLSHKFKEVDNNDASQQQDMAESFSAMGEIEVVNDIRDDNEKNYLDFLDDISISSLSAVVKASQNLSSMMLDSKYTTPSSDRLSLSQVVDLAFSESFLRT